MSPALRPSLFWKSLLIAALALLLAACNPIAIITVDPAKVVVNEEITFDGSGTMVTATPEGTRAIRFEWDFGDGTTATGEEVTHTYTRTGTFSVKLTVTDSAGRVGSATEPVKVLAASSSGTTGSGTETDTESEAESAS